MLLRQMKYFVTIVDCGSFTEAAERLFISQSAISQQMKALEQELGVELLQRENRRFSLTPAGEYFYRRSKALLSEAEDICQRTIRLGQDGESQLHIGFLNLYCGQELHYAIAEFSALYPDVEITIANGTHEELYHRMRNGELDLVLSDQRRVFSPDYVNLTLAHAPVLAELSSRHYLSGLEQLSVEDLKDIPCILVSSRQQQDTEERYYRETLELAESFLFADNLEEARLMVVGNRGFLPLESVGTLPPTQATVRRIPLFRKNRLISRSYCVFWPRERTNYYVEKFAKLLKRLVQTGVSTPSNKDDSGGFA